MGLTNVWGSGELSSPLFFKILNTKKMGDFNFTYIELKVLLIAIDYQMCSIAASTTLPQVEKQRPIIICQYVKKKVEAQIEFLNTLESLNTGIITKK